MHERASVVPESGTIQAEADGTLRWRPDLRWKQEESQTLLVLGLILGVLGGVGVTGVLVAGKEVAPVMVTLAAVSVLSGSLMIGKALRSRCSGEEWRASPDHLELRQTLFGWQWAAHFRGAALELVYSPADSWTSGGRGVDTYHESQLTEAEAVRDPKTWWGLFVLADGRRRCLLSSSRARLGVGDLRRLGEALSERTGWPLVLRRS